ncbi:unnamed protein product [Pleuronectes platessa]|uniref:Uncharacterized protein n=1 Tax=Pleuronectes platessa TaxID=8262 RepID=A0A9N7YSP7_PLEPL|nr:unnamed protein product [Pleuronectes platessa]
MGSPPDSTNHIPLLLIRLHWPLVQHRKHYTIPLLTFKGRHDLVPPDLSVRRNFDDLLSALTSASSSTLGHMQRSLELSPRHPPLECSLADLLPLRSHGETPSQTDCEVSFQRCAG